MAFERKTWKNRQSEHPNRRKLTAAGNEGEYDVERAEGLILEDGDAFDQDTMNDLEGRIAAGIAQAGLFACTLLADGWAAREAAAGGGYAQTVACPGLLAAYDLEAPQVPSTGVKATDAALKEGLDALCEAGNAGETQDGFLKWVCCNSPPTVDLPLRLRRAAVEAADDDEKPVTPDES